MIDSDFIEKIETLVKKNTGIITDGAGKEYSFENLKRVYSDPRPSSINIKSLDGLVDYIKSNPDKYEIADLIIHVVDYRTVKLLTKIQGETNERHTVLIATLDDVNEFPFGRQLGQEAFIIKCNSLFQDTTDLASIIRYTAKIDTENKVITEDDGIGQNVRILTGTSGVAGERASIPSKVKLKPFRTFQELEQPQSEFLFRMATGEGGATCTLHEADGGSWVRDARKIIAGYLDSNIEVEIPIIS
jgi:hypothetical protein